MSLKLSYFCFWPLLKRIYCQTKLFYLHTEFSSVPSLSHVRLFATPWIAAHQASCPSPAPGVHSDSRPSSLWCHPAISSSVIPFSSCPQSLPASGSFPMSQLFAWGGQSTGIHFYFWNHMNREMFWTSNVLDQGTSLVAQLVKNPPTMQETPVCFVGQEDPLENG